MDDEWFESTEKISRLQELLRKFKDDEKQKGVSIIAALDKAQHELERNACLLLELDRVQRAATMTPRSEKIETQMLEKSSSLIQELDHGITKVVDSYAAVTLKSPQ